MRIGLLLGVLWMAVSSCAWAIAPNIQPSVTVFIAGSEAQSAGIVATIAGTNATSGAICQAGTVDVYLDNNSAAGGAAQVAVFCQGASGLPSGLAGVPVLVYYRTNGGSIFGVYPVGSTALHRYDIGLNVTAGCPAAPGYPGAKCTGWTGPGNQVMQIPDLGFSDEEPAVYVGLNLPTPPACINSIFSDPCPQSGNNYITRCLLPLAMEVVVNDGLSNALVAAEGLAPGSRPDLTSEEVVTSFARSTSVYNASDWSALSSVIHGRHPTGAQFSGPVRICRMTSGSGVQAAFNIQFLRQTCCLGGLTPADISDTGPGYEVLENATFAGVRACLNSAQASGTKAIGLLPASETPQPGDHWNYVTINGFDPSGAATGGYDYWVEGTMQVGKTISANVSAFASALYSGIRLSGTPGSRPCTRGCRSCSPASC